jgi:hypothetical protein
MFDIAFLLSIPKAWRRWRGNLKGLLHERGWVKYAKNLGASPPLREIYRMIPLSAKKSRWAIPLINVEQMKQTKNCVTSYFSCIYGL